MIHNRKWAEADQGIILEEICENQRKENSFGHPKYSEKSLKFYERKHLSTFNGDPISSFDNYFLPSPKWEWIAPWTPLVAEGKSDHDGWMYATKWKSSSWHPDSSYHRRVRTRIFVRPRQKVSTGKRSFESRRLDLFCIFYNESIRSVLKAASLGDHSGFSVNGHGPLPEIFKFSTVRCFLMTVLIMP